MQMLSQYLRSLGKMTAKKNIRGLRKPAEAKAEEPAAELSEEEIEALMSAEEPSEETPQPME